MLLYHRWSTSTVIHQLQVSFFTWKTARLRPIFKRDNETDSGNYRPVSLLSVPTKILEAVINDRMVQYIFKDNKLCQKINGLIGGKGGGHSRELLLVHMTEIRRETLDSGSVMAAAFVDFRKAFDSAPHGKLENKLESHFGITGEIYWNRLKATLVEERNTLY